MNFDEIYQEGLKSYGESPQALHWINYPSQAIRFKYLVKDLEIEGKTILDAGCGMGDVLPFLYARADKFKYLGVDKNQNFIDIAKKRYSGHSFSVGDPFSGKFEGKYDVVLSSGVMNHNIDGWLKERQRMITALFGLTKEVLAFNMAGGFKPIASDSKIAYANTNDVLDFCLTLTNKVSLRTDYSGYDFTVIMRR